MPWKVEGQVKHYENSIIDSNHQEVAEVVCGKTNTQYIVKAVNNHQALVDMVTEMSSFCCKVFGEDDKGLVAKAKELLTKIEGE